MAAAGQHVLEGILDAGDAAVVEIGEAHHVAHQRAQRIDALFLGLEIKAGNSKPRHIHLLARRQIALQPDEGLVGGELGLQLRLAEVGQHAGQFLRRLVGIQHLAGIGEQRERREAGGQHHAIAIDDVGALGDRGHRALIGQARLAHILQQGDIDQPADDGQERQCEQ